MDIEEIIRKKLLEKFEQDEFSDCYLVDISYLASNNKVNVFIDCDSALTLEKCTSISRYLEAHLDEELPIGEKYTLEVSSPGLDRPLKFLRQYHKNLGRFLEVTDQDGEKTIGKLIEVSDDGITLEFRVNKNFMKKTIQHSNIAKAFVQIKF